MLNANDMLGLVVQLVRLAKKLKKEKVNVDIVSFGEDVSVTETSAACGLMCVWVCN